MGGSHESNARYDSEPRGHRETRSQRGIESQHFVVSPVNLHASEQALIFNRVELEGAVTWDLIPVVPLPTQWLRHCPETTISESRVVELWKTALPANTGWIELYQQVEAFSNLAAFEPFWTADTPSDCLQPTYTGVWANVMIHRFLLLRPLDIHAGPGAVIEEVCRLGSLLYLIPVWRHLGVYPVRSTAYLRNLRILLETKPVEWDGLWNLLLWVLYMACIEAHEEEDVRWFKSQLLLCARQHGLEDWDGIKGCIKKVLWIESVFRPLHYQFSYEASIVY